MKQFIKPLTALSLVWCFFAVIIVTACTTAGANTAHQFDQQAFQTMIVAQAAVEQAKTEAAGTKYAHDVNTVIAHYNEALKAYTAFHAAVDTATATDVNNLKQNLIELFKEIADLRTALGKGGGAIQ